MSCTIWLHYFCGEWEGWDPVNQFNHTSLVAIVTPTDRPKSVHNRCVIEVLLAFLCCRIAFWVFLWVYGLLSWEWARSLPFSLTWSYTSASTLAAGRILSIVSRCRLTSVWYFSLNILYNFSWKIACSNRKLCLPHCCAMNSTSSIYNMYIFKVGEENWSCHLINQNKYTYY